MSGSGQGQYFNVQEDMQERKHSFSFSALPIKYRCLIILPIILCMLLVILCVILGVQIVHNDSNASSNSSKTSNNTYRTPKNLIVLIGDGMGTSYNAAFRIFNNQSASYVDQFFKGRYSTQSLNKWTTTDSAAGAVAFATGIHTLNARVGVDEFANPRGSLLAAAKRKGKGTGVIATKSVIDATPAAFTAHVMYRRWYHLVAEQQAQRQINGAPMLDVLFGGGKKYFQEFADGTKFWSNASVYKGQYGWQTLTDATDDLFELQVSDLPVMGLFADKHFPFYVDRIHANLSDANDATADYPTLAEMADTAMALLSEKYSEAGFFLMVEGSKVDSCGHNNDIVCLLWEMREFQQAIEVAVDFAKADNNTLVVILADHETGGLGLGSNNIWIEEDLRYYDDGKMPIDYEQKGVAYAIGEYIYNGNLDPLPALNLSSVAHNGGRTLIADGLRKWYPVSAQYSRHSAEWMADELAAYTDLEEVYTFIEDDYLGAQELSHDRGLLTDKEKELVAGYWDHDEAETRMKMIATLMNVRTLTGWTTNGHTTADVSSYAYGPSADRFYGHFENAQIGQLLTDIFNVSVEQELETQYIQQAFLNGNLRICDAKDKPDDPIYEWLTDIPYPVGNLLYGQYCVSAWI